jgi:pimeloyl-ACP methyl ester carboxylesterase
MGAAVATGMFLGRKAGLQEDLVWEEVDKPGRVVDIDAYGVHYIEDGEGPAIMLVHGFGGHTYHYRRMIPALAREHRVIAVDLKGFGYSERDANAGLSHEDQATMLRGFANKLGIDRATWVGHSMGGAVVQRFAARYPEMVDAAVLIASASGSAEERRFRQRAAVPAFLLRPVLPILGRFAAARLLEASFYDPAYLTDEIRAAYLRPARLKGSMDGLMAMIRDAADDREIDASRIRMPVLLINGAHDRVVPLRFAQAIRERIPQARLTVVERAGHALIDERADESSRAVRDFLRESLGAAPAAAPRLSGLVVGAVDGPR